MNSNADGKVIIYDDDCPLCQAYTKAFVQAGMLGKNGRKAFSENQACNFSIDWQRAKHEIPLIDLKSGEVKYGVDALAELLAHKFPFIKSILKVKLLNWFCRKLYKLISYNRKIIVASIKTTKAKIDCTPDYSFFWRWMLILVCYIFSVTFFLLSIYLFKETPYSIVIKYFISPFIITPIILSIAKLKKKITEIYSHTALIGLIASFLMLVSSCIQNIFTTSFAIFILSLAIIIAIILKEAWRRFLFMQRYQ